MIYVEEWRLHEDDFSCFITFGMRLHITEPVIQHPEQQRLQRHFSNLARPTLCPLKDWKRLAGTRDCTQRNTFPRAARYRFTQPLLECWSHGIITVTRTQPQWKQCVWCNLHNTCMWWKLWRKFIIKYGEIIEKKCVRNSWDSCNTWKSKSIGAPLENPAGTSNNDLMRQFVRAFQPFHLSFREISQISGYNESRGNPF